MDRQRTFSRADVAMAWASTLLGVGGIAWIAYKVGLPLWPSRVLGAIGIVWVLFALWRDARRGGVASRSSGDWMQGMMAPADDAANGPVGFLRAFLVPPSWTAADGHRGDIARFLAPARDTPAAWAHVWAVLLLTAAGVGLVDRLTDPFGFPALLGTFGLVWIIWHGVRVWHEARRDG